MTTEQLIDLLAATQKELGRLRWTSVGPKLNKYHALPQILKKDRVKFDSGTSITGNMTVSDSGAARNVGMYADDVYGMTDTLVKFDVPWRHTNTNWIIERREIAMNRRPAKILDLVKLRRFDAMISLAKIMETNFWGKPADSSDDTTPWGIAMWAVKNATEGHFGGNPAGFAGGVAGIDSDVYSGWRNYSGAFAEFTRFDCLRRLKRAGDKVHFESPVDHPNYRRGKARQCYYGTYTAKEQLEAMAEDRNDNMGIDLDPANGGVRINRLPFKWTPQLDADTSNPIYLIDWSLFYTVCLAGEYMNESPPKEIPGKHTTVGVNIDTTWNTRCVDRRGLGVLHQVPLAAQG